jgi:hypothetical protein
MGGENFLLVNCITGEIVLVVKETLGSANPFCATGTENLFACIHIKQLIFQRGTAYVAN